MARIQEPAGPAHRVTPITDRAGRRQAVCKLTSSEAASFCCFSCSEWSSYGWALLAGSASCWAPCSRPNTSKWTPPETMETMEVLAMTRADETRAARIEEIKKRLAQIYYILDATDNPVPPDTRKRLLDEQDALQEELASLKPESEYAKGGSTPPKQEVSKEQQAAHLVGQVKFNTAQFLTDTNTAE